MALADADQLSDSAEQQQEGLIHRRRHSILIKTCFKIKHLSIVPSIHLYEALHLAALRASAVKRRVFEFLLLGNRCY